VTKFNYIIYYFDDAQESFVGITFDDLSESDFESLRNELSYAERPFIALKTVIEFDDETGEILETSPENIIDHNLSTEDYEEFLRVDGKFSDIELIDFKDQNF